MSRENFEKQVYYESLGHEHLYDQTKWLALRSIVNQTLEEDFELPDHLNDAIKRAAYLEGLAKAERQKEVKYLSRFFGTNINGDILDDGMDCQLMDAFADAMGIKEDWDRLLIAVRDNKKLMNKQYRLGSALVSEYINKAFVDHLKGRGWTVQEYFQSVVQGNKGKLKQNEKEFFLMYDDAIEQGLDNFFKQEVKDLGEESQQMLYKYYQTLLKTRTIFDRYKRDLKADLYSRTGIYSMFDDMQSIKGNGKLKKRADYLQKTAMKVQTDFRTQGFFLESFGRMISQLKALEIDEPGFQLSTFASSTTSTFDTMFAYEGADLNATAEVRSNLEEIFNYHKGNGWTSKSDVVDKIEAFTRDLEEAQFDGILVYENTKSRAFSNTSDTYLHGGQRSLSGATKLFTALGATPAMADTFYFQIINSVDGAMGADRREAVDKKVTDFLSAGIANLLFDDWSTIGNVSNVQAIHVFRINAAILPLSVLLRLMAEAMLDTTSKELNRLFRVNITRRGLLYPYDPGDEKYTARRVLGWTNNSDENWLKQENFAATGNISVDFMGSFVDFLRSLVS